MFVRWNFQANSLILKEEYVVMYQLHLTFLHDTWRCNCEKYFGSSNMQSPHGSRIGHVTFAWKPLIKFTSNAPTKVNLEKRTCSHTINNDLFTGRVIYLAKMIIRWWYFTCRFFSSFHNPLYYMYIFYKIDLQWILLLYQRDSWTK